MPGFDASYSLKRNNLVIVSFDLDDRDSTFTLYGVEDQLTPAERAELKDIERLHFAAVTGTKEKATLTDLLLLTNQPTAQPNPAASYLSGLAPGSRRTLAESLRTILRLILNNDVLPTETIYQAAWHQLHFQHTKGFVPG